MNCINREKLRAVEYNNKIERISKLEEELKSNLMELKNKQNELTTKAKDFEQKNSNLKDKETRLKTLVEDEKRRSNTKVQSSTRELREEVVRFKTENRTLENRVKELERLINESKSKEREVEKTQSLINETKIKNETLTQKMLEVEAKLEKSLSEQLFYKKAFENSEIKIQKLVEENNRSKSDQIHEQKDEINRLRSELMTAMQKNEYKLTNHSALPTNASLAKEIVPLRNTIMPTTTSSLRDENTLALPDDILKVPNQSNIDVFKHGKHPAGLEKKHIDINEHISMLQKEKSMFLKTKVYSDEDPIVKQLNEKIEALLKIRPEN